MYYYIICYENCVHTVLLDGTRGINNDWVFAQVQNNFKCRSGSVNMMLMHEKNYYIYQKTAKRKNK